MRPKPPGAPGDRIEPKGHDPNSRPAPAEDRFPVAKDHWSGPWVVFDSDAKILEANEQAGKLFTLDGAGPVGQSLSSCIFPEDIPRFMSHLRNCRAGFDDLLTDLRILTPGGIMPVRLITFQIAASARSRFRTAILRGPPALEARASVAEQIVEQLEHPVAVVDPSIRLIYFNQAFLSLAGLRRADALAASLFNLPGIRWQPLDFRSRLVKVLSGERLADALIVQGEKFPRGSPLQFQIKIRRLRNEGSPRALAILELQNLSERRNSDAERDAMLRQIHNLSGQLEMKVQERTCELEAANARLTELSTALIDAQENERRRLACELHDEVGQNLTGLNLLLDKISKQVPPGDQQHFNEASVVLARLLRQIRELSVSLRPQLLDDMGLNVALKWLIDGLRQSCPSTLRLELDPRIESVVSPQSAITIYRVIQESLTNALKHARAKNIRIRVRARTRDIILSVRDDGVGFDSNEKALSPTTGLSGMRERVGLLGGVVNVQSRVGGGTTIRCVIPASLPLPAR